MIRTDVTLYTPAGDGVKQNSHTITYKGVKDFKITANNTVTFKTNKNVEIETPLFWRKKTGEAADLDALASGTAEEAQAPVPRAGNRAGWGH